MPYVEIEIIAANGLPSADVNGKSDPYVYVSTSKCEIKTEIKKRTLDPTWNETVVMEIGNPLKDAVGFQIFDWDRIGDHDFLGACTVMVNDLIPGEYKDMTLDVVKIDKKEWINKKRKGATKPPLTDRGKLHIKIRALDFGPYVQPPDVQGYPIYFHCLPGFPAPAPVISPVPYKDPLPPIARLPNLDNYEGEVPKEWKRMKCGFLKAKKDKKRGTERFLRKKI